MKHLIAISCVFLFWPIILMASASNLAYTKNHVIEPGKTHEACMWLSPGDRLYYEFTSNANLRFNIHYHEGKKAHYPVPVKLTSLEKAVFEPESRKEYCLMWKNPEKQRVNLKLHYQKQN